MAIELVTIGQRGRAGYSYPAVRLGMYGLTFLNKAVKEFRLDLFNAMEVFVDREKKKVGFNPLVHPTEETFNLYKHRVLNCRTVYHRFDFLKKFLTYNKPKDCVFKLHREKEDNATIMFWIHIEEKGGDD